MMFLLSKMSDMSRKTTTNIHIMALDGIVNVNSLFTLALFLGISTTNPNNTLIAGDTSCAAGPSVVEGILTFHVYSFSSFLFSSLIALSLKNIININKGVQLEEAGDIDGSNRHVHGVGFVVRVNTVALKVGTLVSAFGSVFGCGFLVMALVDLVQIKLGTLGCGSHYTYLAIAPLLILVPTALLIFIFLVLYAFTS